MTTPKLFWLFSLAVLLIQGVLAYPQLPDQMVTHMSLEGEPDGFGSKSGFYLSFGLAVLLINIMPPLLSILLKKLPESLINLPNKEYWFADATRKAKSHRPDGWYVGRDNGDGERDVHSSFPADGRPVHWECPFYSYVAYLVHHSNSDPLSSGPSL
ncbi:MAG: DUF1648 domain-containing protein [bacterium]|nr:DUF1648 domain-containing protein [bacterium]